MTEMESGDKLVGELQNVHSAYQLNGKDLKWSQLIKTILIGKGKAIYLTDDALAEDDPRSRMNKTL